jgi:hypothetical protein
MALLQRHCNDIPTTCRRLGYSPSASPFGLVDAKTKDPLGSNAKPSMSTKIILRERKPDQASGF